MSQDLLDEFGQAIAKHVRDKEIAYWENVFKHKKLDIYWEKYRNALEELTEEQLEFLREVGIQTIDGVIHDFLLILDDHWISIELTDKDGNKHDMKEIAKGGLQGYIYEWTERFSEHRTKTD